MVNDEPEDGAWPGALYAVYVTFVLTLAYSCSFIDRQILTLLIEPIRRDLHVSDTEVSLLGGIAFTAFYTLLGIPLARLADRTHRRNLMAAGVATWSMMTALCGLARGFWPLFAARVGVGVGEAALSPAAFSVLADYFPLRRLGRAIGAYCTGVYFGSGLALLIGGTVIATVSSVGTRVLPVIGTVFPWQLVFFVVAAIGLPMVLLMLTVREPRRRGVARVAVDGSASRWPALRAFLLLNRRTLVCHFGGFSLFGIAINCYLFWGPTLMIRNFGWSAPHTGYTIGVMMLTLGTAGVFGGGWVADRLASAGRLDAILRAAFIGVCFGLPFLVGTPLLRDAGLATAGLAIAIFFCAYPQGLPAAAIQAITPNPLRAQVTAVYFFIGNLIANGLGPVLPALLTDHVYHDPGRLRDALALIAATTVPLSALLMHAGLAPYRESLRRVSSRLTDTRGAPPVTVAAQVV